MNDSVVSAEGAEGAEGNVEDSNHRESSQMDKKKRSCKMVMEKFNLDIEKSRESRESMRIIIQELGTDIDVSVEDIGKVYEASGKHVALARFNHCKSVVKFLNSEQLKNGVPVKEDKTGHEMWKIYRRHMGFSRYSDGLSSAKDCNRSAIHNLLSELVLLDHVTERFQQLEYVCKQVIICKRLKDFEDWLEEETKFYPFSPCLEIWQRSRAIWDQGRKDYMDYKDNMDCMAYWDGMGRKEQDNMQLCMSKSKYFKVWQMGHHLDQREMINWRECVINRTTIQMKKVDNALCHSNLTLAHKSSCRQLLWHEHLNLGMRARSAVGPVERFDTLPEDLRQEIIQVNKDVWKFVLHCEKVLPVLKREWFSENNIKEGIVVADFFKELNHLNGIYKDNPWKEQLMCEKSCESYIKIERAIVQLVKDEPSCALTLFPLLMFSKDGSAKTKESRKLKKREAKKRRKLSNSNSNSNSNNSKNNSNANETNKEAKDSSASDSNKNEAINKSNTGAVRENRQDDKDNDDDDGDTSNVSNSSKTSKDCKEKTKKSANDKLCQSQDESQVSASAYVALAVAPAASNLAASAPADSGPATSSKRCCSCCGKVMLRKKSFGECGKCKAASKRFPFKFERNIYCGETCLLADWESRHKQFHQDLEERWCKELMDEEDENDDEDKEEEQEEKEDGEEVEERQEEDGISKRLFHLHSSCDVD